MNINFEKNINAFLYVLAGIVLIGIVMVYSSSYIYAKEFTGRSSYFFVHQVTYLGLGCLIAFITSRVRFTFWMKYSLILNNIAIALLLLTLVPKIGLSIKGAHRWLQFAGFRFQPGEIVKYTQILCSVYFFNNFDVMEKKERISYVISMLLPLLIFVIQPDFGTFTICLSVTFFACFLSHFPRKIFYTLMGAGFAGGLIILFLAPYRVQRVLTYLDPWKDPKRSGFQIIQSYLAFANGSIFGQGIGNSTEKLFYLPEAHNDFIFSVIGEELGFVGICFMVFLFLLFIFLGFKLAIYAKNELVSVLVATIIFAIGFQAFLNMGVVLGLLPTKGLNLPFISYGGSSLMSNFFAIGMILSALSYSFKSK